MSIDDRAMQHPSFVIQNGKKNSKIMCKNKIRASNRPVKLWDERTVKTVTHLYRQNLMVDSQRNGYATGSPVNGEPVPARLRVNGFPKGVRVPARLSCFSHQLRACLYARTSLPSREGSGLHLPDGISCNQVPTQTLAVVLGPYFQGMYLIDLVLCSSFILFGTYNSQFDT
jgi:hypothetical protein